MVVLCATGTAAQGNLNMMLDLDAVGIYGPPFIPTAASKLPAVKPQAANGDGPPSCCSLVHLPYSDSINLPYNFRSSKCRLCKVGKVPDVMFTTVEPPPKLELIGEVWQCTSLIVPVNVPFKLSA